MQVGVLSAGTILDKKMVRLFKDIWDGLYIVFEVNLYLWLPAFIIFISIIFSFLRWLIQNYAQLVAMFNKTQAFREKAVVSIRKTCVEVYRYNPFMERNSKVLVFFLILSFFLPLFMLFVIAPYMKSYLLDFVVPSDLQWLERQLAVWQNRLTYERMILADWLDENALLMKKLEPAVSVLKAAAKAVFFKAVLANLHKIWDALMIAADLLGVEEELALLKETWPYFLSAQDMLAWDPETSDIRTNRYCYLIGRELWQDYWASYAGGIIPEHDVFGFPSNYVQFWWDGFFFLSMPALSTSLLFLR
jgi:hypothetical protein